MGVLVARDKAVSLPDPLVAATNCSIMGITGPALADTDTVLVGATSALVVGFSATLVGTQLLAPPEARVTLLFTLEPNAGIGVAPMLHSLSVLECSPGSQPNGNQCVECADGSASVDGRVCLPCTAGTISGGAGSAGCTNCTAGSHQVGLACALCTTGTYTGRPGLDTCSDCPAGTSSPADGASSCQPCAAGHVSSAKASACTRCTAGQFANTGTWTCDTCASGFVSVGDGWTECRACEAGTVSNVAATACDACPPGHVNPEPNASWGCEPCPWRLWLVSWSASSVRAAMSPTRYVRRARRVLPVTSRRRKAHQAAQHVSPGTPRGPYVD